ncbi:hypothetical protein [Dickeya oryzae]
MQDGWKGHILPFELVQKTHLSSDLQALAAQETRLAEIASALEEILESLSEEEKEQDTVKRKAKMALPMPKSTKQLKPY